MNNNKKTKRANGEGHIRMTSEGYWEARITNGYNSEGKQIFKTFTNKKQYVVIAKLNEFKTNREKFNDESAIKYSVKEWLEVWYETYVVNNVKTSTRISYEGIINNKLVPHIGKIKLVKLKKYDIEKMYNELIKNGRSDRQKCGLSIKTIRNIHLVLHKALQEAFAREYISRNPCDIAKVPTLKELNLKKKEIEVYSLKEQHKLIKFSKEDNIYGTVVIFALYTGMRKGEILGLKWSDIDFEKKTISVNKQLMRLKDFDTNAKKKTKLDIQYNTKTNNSTRLIPISKTLESILKEHLKYIEANRKTLDKLYKNNDMVFCKEDGSYLDPDTVLEKYYKIVEKSEIKKCTFHALRHTFATRALESGMPPKVVSKILGHASVQFTLDTYTHILPELQVSEMDKLDKYMKQIAV